MQVSERRRRETFCAMVESATRATADSSLLFDRQVAETCAHDTPAWPESLYFLEESPATLDVDTNVDSFYSDADSPSPK